MSDEKLILEVMQSVIIRTRAYFEGEFGISVAEIINSEGNLNSFEPLDMTAIIGMNGAVNLLIVFSFQEGLINALYERMTEGFNVQPDEVEMYREAAAGEVVNTILGHCTIVLQKLDRRGISMTPPVIIDQVKSIRRMKDAMLHTQNLNTSLGDMNISLVGPRGRINTNLDYVK